MDIDEAVRLIEKAVEKRPSVWADVGAGSGIFTLALEQILGFNSVIFAVDKKLEILRDTLKTRYSRSTIHLYEKDFSQPMAFLPPLDGLLLANVLHYIADQESFLRNLCNHYLKDGGTVMVIEYDRFETDPWVPYPLPLPYFERLSSKIGLTLPEEIGRKRSIYGNQDLYVAYCHK